MLRQLYHAMEIHFTLRSGGDWAYFQLFALMHPECQPQKRVRNDGANTLRRRSKQRASEPQILLLRANHSHLNPTETKKDSRITASAHLALIKVQSCAAEVCPC